MLTDEFLGKLLQLELVTSEKPEVIKGQLFPAVSLGGGCKIEANFGPEGFVYKFEGVMEVGDKSSPKKASKPSSEAIVPSAAASTHEAEVHGFQVS